MKNGIYRILCFFAAVLTASLTSFSSFAADSVYSGGFAISANGNADSGVQLLRGIAYEDIAGRCEYIISDFNDDDGGWKAKENIKRLTVTTAVPAGPFRIFEGRRHLRAIASDGTADSAHSVEKSFDEPLDASEYNSLFVALNVSCGDISGANCEITATLYAGEEAFERIFHINPEEITGAVIDISEFEGRAAISGIELSFKISGAETGEEETLLLLDYVALSASSKLAAAVNFLTDSYVAGSGDITVGDDCISFVSGGDGAYIETTSLEYEFPDNTNAICVKLANFAGAERMTFYYTTEDAPQYKSINSHEIQLYNDPEAHYYYIPVRSLNIMQFRIVFDGGEPGLINIHMLRAVESFSYVQTEYGSLDSVTISDNKRDIVIRGTISSDIIEIYRNSSLSQNTPVALYCLDPGDDHTDIITLATSQIDQTGIKESFRFTVPLETDDYSRINCKFAVGITTSNGITLIDDCEYISNPEILAASAAKPGESATKKAVATSAVTAEELCADSYIEINLCRLLSSVASDIYTESVDGIYYFNASYVRQLDTEISRFARSDVSLTASLTVFPSDDAAVNELLIPDSIQARYTSSAFNVSGYENTAAIYNAVSFLVRRYSVDTPVITGYIAGGNICDSEYGYWSGRIPITEYVKNYCNALRVIYNAVKSTCAYPEVYIRAGYSWDDFSAGSDISDFSARQLLDMIALRIRAEGDIDWSLAADVTREDVALYLSYNDSFAVESFSSGTISVKNIDMLCRYMELDALKYSGDTRGLIVLDFREAVPDEDAEADRVEYIYSFIKLNSADCLNVKKYITRRNCEDAETLEMLKYIDSEEKFGQYSDFALNRLAIESWSLLIPSASELPELRTISELPLSDALSEAITGSYVLFDFSGMYSENGWTPSVNCSLISTGNEVIDHSSLLTASLSRYEDTPYRGIVNKLERPLDLSAAPYMSFDIQIIGASRDIELFELIVTVYSGSDYIEFRGDLHSAEWYNTVLDLSSFAGLSSVNKIRIWISDGGNDIASPTMMLSSISVSSPGYSDEELAQHFLDSSGDGTGDNAIDGRIIWVTVVIAVISATALVLHMLSNRRGLDRTTKK